MSMSGIPNDENEMLVTDIGTLAVVPPGPLPGRRMREVILLCDAALAIEDGRIAWFGPAADAPDFKLPHRLSAGGGCVIPGLIDPHTHIPFIGDRSGEFVRRVGGESYLSIMESGGGIRVTTEAVRAASEQQLVDENLPRLRRMLALGVTTCECKSGYGLDPEHELKQLRVTAEDVQGKYGSSVKIYFHCENNDGTSMNIPVNNEVSKSAAFAFLEKVRKRGIPVLEQ